ncbi:MULTISPECIES: hypothetical protein [unclassified Streptomyces]|uniref:hypothetical protein n=1 Tax=unclassified Streptomyces TaxID=2593676 RepID=UPI002E2D5325|nr:MULTISPECIES: hypothetical protein [unclassified Streptomyces]
MIRAGRTPVGTADVAKLLGRKTLPAALAKSLPAPISRAGAQSRIWDLEQVEAHLAGREIPTIAEVESADDLLDREEARLLLRNAIKPTAWNSYIDHGFAPSPDEKVCGVSHWRRSTILEWDANRPGEGAGGGRPKGSKDTKPRDRVADARLARADARKERVRQMLREAGTQLTPADVAAAEDISERQAYRLLDEARAAAE